jgi:23S rRNA pseudouridine1911/1915/1917 synthase
MLRKEITLVIHSNEIIRIDKYLAGLELKELVSRSFIDKLFESHFITVNGKIAKKSDHIKNLGIVKIRIPDTPEQTLTPEKIDLDIVYEDENIAIVNKPAGMVVHPSPGHYSGTLANALLYYFERLSNENSCRPGIVHRLDMNTSGLMIVTKDIYTHSLLKKMFGAHEIKKIYLALTMGNLDKKEDTIKTCYGRNPKNRQKMAVLPEGKKAITHYKVINSYPGFDLTKIFLETGRTHQIRVHFSHLHHPIMGDKIYSSKRQMINLVPFSMKDTIKYILENILTRQALHSHELEFIHPITHTPIRVCKEMPEDMKKVLEIVQEEILANSTGYFIDENSDI